MIYYFQSFYNKSMLLLSMLLLFVMHGNPCFAQQHNPQRNHSLTPNATLQTNVPDTLTIVAVRVSFQADNNRFTTGDGTFSSDNLPYLDNADITIDPLPHDQSYFEHHLKFAKNYFGKVSGNKLHIKYRVLPAIYKLPEKMEAYSPTGEKFTNEKVANLAADTWQVVEEQGGFATDSLDPDKTAFAIFHAGIGRDIELTGTTLDKTPQDIPSLFLDQGAFADLLNQPDFDGFTINNGQFSVTNSMILPRSLSRRGENVAGEEFVLQLSINGLLCASIGSYLGLPDLFNTETGNSGIGRFGLMDGESFFSYRGLFPPEPSAWEKVQLGWQSPISTSPSHGNPVALPSASLHQNNSIAKVSLSADEYFLIENRHRDANGDGVTLTFEQSNGTVQTKQYTNYDEAFVEQTDEFEDILIPGVVTDVSNPEWSLPGGLDPGPDTTRGTDDRLLNGGILIWHIDEAVIKKNLGRQGINDNPNRRGIDLEEADGAQDIGRAANEDFSQQARGTAFDFWWEGNNASVVTLDGDTLSFYENRFGADTRPSNESNSGAPSFFELYDFSDNQSIASFRIRPQSSDNIATVDLPVTTVENEKTYTDEEAKYFSDYPLGLSLFTAQPDSFLIIPTRQTTYALHLNNEDNPLIDFQSGTVQQPYLGDQLLLGDAPLQSQIDLTAWQWNGTQWNSQWNSQIQANNAFLSSNDDQTLFADFTRQRIELNSGSVQSPLPNPQQRSKVNNHGQFTVLTENELTIEPDGNSYPISPNQDWHYTGAINLTENKPGFFYLSEDELLIFDADQFGKPKTIVENTEIGWPAMSDINSDGQLDFIYVNKETGALEARNTNGALLSYFPIQPPQNTTFVGTPLITSSTQSGKKNLYILTQDSLSLNINAYTSNGDPVDGFPLYVGNISEEENEPIHPIIHQNILYAVSHYGDVKAWKLSNIEKVLWASKYGNTFNNKVSGSVEDTPTQNPASKNTILVKDETYNWPNPAKDFTNIRFQTGGTGIVDVKIITSGGRVIFDEHFEANGQAPEEHQVSTQNWSSGVYFAMITATVDGQKARKMIKIAVVK